MGVAGLLVLSDVWTRLVDPGNFEISLEKGEREFEREGSNVTNKSK